MARACDKQCKTNLEAEPFLQGSTEPVWFVYPDIEMCSCCGLSPSQNQHSSVRATVLQLYSMRLKDNKNYLYGCERSSHLSEMSFQQQE